MSGQILDSKTGQPVDYVNIGIINRAQGTVSGADGKFILNDYNGTISDSVQISRIGYKSLKFSLEEIERRLAQSSIIEMTEELTELEEVILDLKNSKKNRIGYTRTTEGFVAYWNNRQSLGGEHAAKILIRKGPVKLEDLSFKVVKNISDSLLVRVNIYEIDNGLPGRNISKNNILYTIKQKGGQVIIDLSPYNIVVDKNFIVSLELLKVYGRHTGITIAGFMDGSRSYSRTVSQDRWRRMRKGHTISFNLQTSIVENSQLVINSKRKLKKPSNVKILWDHSFSMKNRDLEKEFTYLDIFFKKLGDVKVNLQTYGYDLGDEIHFAIRNGNWDKLKLELRNSINEGGSRQQVLDSLKPEQFTLIFSDGLDFYEDINLDWNGKIYSINTISNANHELLYAIAKESGGTYINLSVKHNLNKAADYRKMHGNYILNKPIAYKNGGGIEVHGTVSDFEDPLENVLVEVKPSALKTRTNKEGNFTIQAKPGDILKFSYPGRESIEMVVNNGNSNLQIIMPIGVNVLDEVVVTENQKLNSLEAPLSSAVTTSFGTLDPLKTGFAVKQIKGSELNRTSENIWDALRGKFPGVRIVGNAVWLRVGSDKFAGWDIDGNLYFPNNPPEHINILEVKSITIMQGSWAFARYGSLGAGGIVIVRTTADSMTNSEGKNGISNEFSNNNFYKGGAVLPENELWKQPEYLRKIGKASSEQEAYAKYLEERKNWSRYPAFYFDVHNYFVNSYSSYELANKILSNIKEVANNDVTALRLLAYAFDATNQNDLALEIYNKLWHLNPDQLQAIRDIAQANVRLGDYKKGWDHYLNYLKTKNDSLEFGSLDKIVRQEMMDLVENYSDEINVDQSNFSFEKDKEDISVIVQWNNPNAEFELQFVGPTGRYYTWRHTEAENSLLLAYERESGSYSKSFGIQDIGEGPWMINSRYLGNKESTPTYLKFTIRNNDKIIDTVKVIKLRINNINYRALNISEKEVISYFK